ncbi:unnamed protein product [Peronospora belbahrii]|uniref:Uncharacterized protein n=1 Tax=Peronospora belbahrii TaxID=622444 RepID=A0AAU9L422_9STRA|nr:unnamed protein product [Peronospora belbahrii]CAH0516391.1 unnamed protein product [Peronospora belbahrii]
MSTYLPSGYLTHAKHFRPSTVTGPLAAYELDDGDDFYSDIDVVERDIDAEIEARQKQPDVASARALPPFSPPALRTMSQRMLQSLQQQRAQNRAAVELSPRRRTSRAGERNMGNVKADLSSVANKRTPVSSSVTMTDTAFHTSLSSRSRSSCTDRLEARISKSFLARKDHGPGCRVMKGEQDEPLLYSERETYPAMSLRKTEGYGRMSDNQFSNVSTPQVTKMLEIMDKERAMRTIRPTVSCSDIPSDTKKDNGVMFHFQRGSSVTNDVLNVRMERLALTDGRADTRVANALVKAQSLKRVTDPEYMSLVSQLATTESMVDSIDSCIKKPSFLNFAAHMLNEMELLVKTTQQIRTNGTTMILANVGKPQHADMTQALRRLVARAVLVQKRIGVVMNAVKQLVV